MAPTPDSGAESVAQTRAKWTCITANSMTAGDQVSSGRPGWPEVQLVMNAITLPLAGGTPAISTPTVAIRWQRFVGERGGTCARCGNTEAEVRQAAAQLEQALAPLGIAVTFERQALDTETFRRDVDASNRIWVNDRLLEDWLGADVGTSACTFCGTEAGTAAGCRTLVHAGQTYETIPATLIVQAGLTAAAQVLSGATHTSCGCGDPVVDHAVTGSCCS